MATSSIFEKVLKKDKKKIGRLVSALESSRDSRVARVAYSRSVERVDDVAQIQKILGVQRNDGVQDSDD